MFWSSLLTAGCCSDRRPSGGGADRADVVGARFPFGARLDPPSGFTDPLALGQVDRQADRQAAHTPHTPHEVSEAECDMDTLHRLKKAERHADRPAAKPKAKRMGGAAASHFTIAV